MTVKHPHAGRPRIFSVGATSRVCSRCKIEKGATDFKYRKNGMLYNYCCICRRERLQEWRIKQLTSKELELRSSKVPGVTYNNRRTKALLAFGNMCQKCGYSKCQAALHFHHVDSSKKKEWMNSYYKSILEVEAHPERFLLLCSNCHTEVHHP